MFVKCIQINLVIISAHNKLHISANFNSKYVLYRPYNNASRDKSGQALYIKF